MKRLCLLFVMAFAAATFSAGCESDSVWDEGEETTLELQVSGLDGSCSSPENAAAITKYRVKVVDNTMSPPEVVADEEFPTGSKVLKINKVPESPDLELSLVGMTGTKGAGPVYFGRSRGIQVLKNKPTRVDLVLGRYADYACEDAPSGAPNVLFPTVTTLPNGKVLIAGGFTKAVDDTGRYEITGPSDRAYVYDPGTGEIRPSVNLMNRGRGAHAAVYLPKKGQVLLVGGSDRMYMEKSQAKFQWYFLKDKMGDVGTTYELFDVASESFIPWDGETWPDEGNKMVMPVRRVFPGVSLNNDGTVLVTGGGQWRSVQTKMETDADYRVAEIYRPASDSYLGGFMDTKGALTMKAMRAGHSTVLMEVRDKLSIHLFWGGSEDGPIAEIYKESSGQLESSFGAFKEIEFLDTAQYKLRPFFHTMTPLANRQFLLAGGVLLKDGKLQIPLAAHAYLIQVTTPSGNDESKIRVQLVDGMGEGRYFHSAYSFDNDHVTLIGGFGSTLQGEASVFASTAMSDLRFFDLTTKKFGPPALDKPGMPRGGFGAALLPNDCVLLAGGVDNPAGGLEFETATLGLVVEQFCPSTVCPESMWDNGCYPEE